MPLKTVSLEALTQGYWHLSQFWRGYPSHKQVPARAPSFTVMEGILQAGLIADSVNPSRELKTRIDEFRGQIIINSKGPEDVKQQR